jgi:hypothetical protein
MDGTRPSVKGLSTNLVMNEWFYAKFIFSPVHQKLGVTQVEVDKYLIFPPPISELF